ncbi:MAG: hypothetical protein Q4B03_01915 [Lachnospiraceae bacterium]|nr:hypothetical protein [Lachnospiraceae bacterium]
MKASRLTAKICRFIPEKVDDAIVLEIYELMQKTGKLLRIHAPASFQKNSEALQVHVPSILRAGGYIEDQFSYGDLTYGKTTMKLAGCEIFAVYNALVTLKAGHWSDLPAIIRDFETEGMVLSGKFGTSPKSMIRYLDHKGFHTEFTTDPSRFESLGKKYRSLILIMYNNASDIREQIHTVHISSESAVFTAHNVYCNGTVAGPSSSLTGLISGFNNGKARGICLIGINNHRM